MPAAYQIKEQDQLYFITLQVVFWIDIFTRESYRKIVVENLAYCQKHKGLEIYGWVIMSNHLHLLVRSNTDSLSDTLRDFKSYTSKKILDEIENGIESRRDWMLKLFKEAASRHKRNSVYQVWTHENHAVHFFSNEFTQQKLNYIHNNPVKAGIVDRAEDYKYSSAISYADGDGLLEVGKIFRKWKTI